MKHTKVRGWQMIPARTCEVCGAAMTVVTKDAEGLLWSSCPNEGRPVVTQVFHPRPGYEGWVHPSRPIDIS